MNPAACKMTLRFHRAGFTIVEAVISVVLVGVLFVAAFNTAGASKTNQYKTAERGHAYLLAQELMSEIMRQDYADPELVGEIDLRAAFLLAGAIGPELGESSANRSQFDDVDDYAGWTASPPQNKDGTHVPNTTGWKRTVTVQRRSLADQRLLSASEEGLKHITVEVTHRGAVMARLEALKGAGLPAVPTGPKVLLVVADDANPAAQESARRTLMESWGFSVILIATTDPLADFDVGVATADVAYVHAGIVDADLGTKLTNATIGVVNEDEGLTDDFGLGTKVATGSGTFAISDNGHYISASFAVGTVALFTTTQDVIVITDATEPTGGRVLGLAKPVAADDPCCIAVESGELLSTGSPAPARRAKLPWGSAALDIATLTPDAQTLMKRTIEWAAGMEKP